MQTVPIWFPRRASNFQKIEKFLKTVKESSFGYVRSNEHALTCGFARLRWANNSQVNGYNWFRSGLMKILEWTHDELLSILLRAKEIYVLAIDHREKRIFVCVAWWQDVSLRELK